MSTCRRSYAFRRRHPNLVLELVLSNALDDLLRREADIAVRVAEPTQEALIAPRLPPIVRRLPALDRPAFALRTDSDLAELAAIRAGFGIGICQAPVARRDPDLVRVLADAANVDLGLWIVMHEDLKITSRCRAVLDALVEGLSTS